VTTETAQRKELEDLQQDLREVQELLRLQPKNLDTGEHQTAPPESVETRERAQHVVELRAALAQVYQAASRSVPTYSTPTLSATQTPISAADIAEIRSAILAIW
jgi:hypothetical protein